MPNPPLHTTLSSWRSLPGPLPVSAGRAEAEDYLRLAEGLRAEGGRLVALWGEDRRAEVGGFLVHTAFCRREGLLVVEQAVPANGPGFPSIAAIFPAAARMERAVYDLLGIRAAGLADHRPWLRHQGWAEDTFPLRKDFRGEGLGIAGDRDYPFIRVEGDGVHEIPVGPVHAGIIEPGHFRFQVLGEDILRLEERLGYTHKGIEKLAEGRTLTEGVRLAGRVSGDSTVAHALAYALATEQATATEVPLRVRWLRALCMERERIANHLGDLGALGNDAGLAFGLAQFGRLKELFLRSNGVHFGHRYLMDKVLPGGVAFDLDGGQRATLMVEGRRLLKELQVLQRIYEEHAGLQDRVTGTGRVTPALAERLGLMGLGGRASGQAWDLRVHFPLPPYDRLELRIALHGDGDVRARMAVRFFELRESLRIQEAILDGLPDGPVSSPLAPAREGSVGVGWVEGWRGEVFAWLRVGEGQRLERYHPQDPSWVLWPVLEHAVLQDIVADFPLVNKSFNLSYSGHDL